MKDIDRKLEALWEQANQLQGKAKKLRLAEDVEILGRVMKELARLLNRRKNHA